MSVLCVSLLVGSSLPTCAWAQSDTNSTPARVAVEGLGALLGGAIGLGAGAGFGLTRCEHDSSCLITAVVIATITTFVAVPGGVTVGGDLMGGDGGFGWSLLGGVGGMLAGGLVFTIAELADVDTSAMWVPMLALFLAGSIVGYELSNEAGTRSDTTRAQPLAFGLGFAF